MQIPLFGAYLGESNERSDCVISTQYRSCLLEQGRLSRESKTLTRDLFCIGDIGKADTLIANFII